MKKEPEKRQHLQWAIDGRARNQECALELLRLFTEYETQWQTRRFAGAAQDLLSVAFSLWRAAFLADRTGQRAVVFSNGVQFLETMIAENAITFVQDRRHKEWTFNYYTRNARAALESLNRNWPDEVARYNVLPTRRPTERWDYCQGLFADALPKFDQLLAKTVAARAERGVAKARRAARRARRKKSREYSRSIKNGEKTTR